jgi:hypothetical protein
MKDAAREHLLITVLFAAIGLQFVRVKMDEPATSQLAAAKPSSPTHETKSAKAGPVKLDPPAVLARLSQVVPAKPVRAGHSPQSCEEKVKQWLNPCAIISQSFAASIGCGIESVIDARTSHNGSECEDALMQYATR